eukprot:6201027-Pleurochrysis_carterae.AAC.8
MPIGFAGLRPLVVRLARRARILLLRDQSPRPCEQLELAESGCIVRARLRGGLPLCCRGIHAFSTGLPTVLPFCSCLTGLPSLALLHPSPCFCRFQITPQDSLGLTASQRLSDSGCSSGRIRSHVVGSVEQHGRLQLYATSRAVGCVCERTGSERPLSLLRLALAPGCLSSSLRRRQRFKSDMSPTYHLPRGQIRRGMRWVALLGIPLLKGGLGRAHASRCDDTFVSAAQYSFASRCSLSIARRADALP